MLWRWRGVDRMSGEQVEGEVDGGIWFQWWWYGEGGKRVGWVVWLTGFDQGVDWVVTGLRDGLVVSVSLDLVLVITFWIRLVYLEINHKDLKCN